MIVKQLFWQAARTIAQNPEVQERAVKIATEAYQTIKPTVENAGRHVVETMHETADEVDLKAHPVEFAQRFRKKLLPDDKNSK